MEYILDISAQGQAAERCSGPAYQLFLDYAFTQADFFMLAFVNYYGKGLPARARQARAQEALTVYSRPIVSRVNIWGCPRTM